MIIIKDNDERIMMRRLIFAVLVIHTAHAMHTDTPAYTQTSHTNTLTNNAIHDPQTHNQMVADILKSQAYSTTYESKQWQKIKQDNPVKEPKQDNTKPNGLIKHLENLSEYIGVAGKVILIGLLGIIVYVLIKNADKLRVVLDKLPKKLTHSTTMRAFDKPFSAFYDLVAHDKIFETVKQLICAGEYLQALSMLYRGTLRAVDLAYELDITHSQTEAMCQKLLSSHANQNEQLFFNHLVMLWQAVAYGKKLPSDIQTQLYKLLAGWQACYVDDRQGDKHDKA